MHINFKINFKPAIIISGLIILFLPACNFNKDNKVKESIINKKKVCNDSIIIDSNYSFEEAIAGTKAPKSIVDQLTLITVKYYSTDSKIHAGQLLINKEIAEDIKIIFDFILHDRFAVYSVIPIVKYQWNDILSMEANNSYSFCYRNVSYSKHAKGMAIDINPIFNPLRWKEGYKHRKDMPEGAIYNSKKNGTFYPSHPVVLKFKEKGFFWGRNFKRNNDDHHFER